MCLCNSHIREEGKPPCVKLERKRWRQCSWVSLSRKRFCLLRVVFSCWPLKDVKELMGDTGTEKETFPFKDRTPKVPAWSSPTHFAVWMSHSHPTPCLHVAAFSCTFGTKNHLKLLKSNLLVLHVKKLSQIEVQFISIVVRRNVRPSLNSKSRKSYSFTC